jgi:hypothetical protein
MIKFFCMCICLFYGIFRIGLNGAPINLTIYMANGIQYLVKGTTVIYYLGKVKGLNSKISPFLLVLERGWHVTLDLGNLVN